MPVKKEGERGAAAASQSARSGQTYDPVEACKGITAPACGAGAVVREGRDERHLLPSDLRRHGTRVAASAGCDGAGDGSAAIDFLDTLELSQS